MTASEPLIAPRVPAPELTPCREGGARDADFAAEALPHRSVLYAAALRYTGSPSDAEDLVQETLVRALAAWRRYTPRSQCRAWLLRILKNSFINHVRRQGRAQRYAREAAEQPGALWCTEGQEQPPTPERALMETELGDEVQAALADLAPAYREAVERADLRGQGYREIAAELGVPVGTVMSRIYRGRRQLEEKLKGYAADEFGLGAPARRAA